MAENILETIAAKRRIYIEEKKKQVPLKNLISQSLSNRQTCLNITISRCPRSIHGV